MTKMVSHHNFLSVSLKMIEIRSALFQNIMAISAYLSLASAAVDIKETFESSKIVPDIIPNIPQALLKASFADVPLTVGDALTVEHTKQQPKISWEDTNTFFTVIMTDPDCPSPANPTLKEMQHWIVGNIYRKNMSSGETFVEYTGPRGEDYSVEQGTHRYIISVFEQIGKLIFAERKIENDNMLLRGQFSTKSFASMYRLRGPVAATYFTVDHPANSSSVKSKAP